MKTGGVRSEVQLTVLAAVEVLPHPSVAIKVLVCDNVHPMVVTAPSL